MASLFIAYIWTSVWIYNGIIIFVIMPALFWIFSLYGPVVLYVWYKHIWPLNFMRGVCSYYNGIYQLNKPQIARFMGPTWGPPGSCRSQKGPMLAPWTLLSGHVEHVPQNWCAFFCVLFVVLITFFNGPCGTFAYIFLGCFTGNG